MATGISYHRKTFQTEIDDNFCERPSLNGQDNQPIREIIRTIFNPNPDEEIVTIEALLSNPYFQVILFTSIFITSNFYLLFAYLLTFFFNSLI